jgi:YVTN family beta-propeller protein
MLNEQFIWLGAAVNVLAGVGYVMATVRGQARPNRVTWGLWSITAWLAFFGQLSEGVGLAVVLTLSVATIPTLIFFGSFIGGAYWKFSKLDVVCLALSLVALVGWQLTASGLVAIVLSIAVDLLAGVPTLVQAWKEPESESHIAYTAGMFNAACTLLTLTTFTIATAAFAIYFFSLCATISFLLLVTPRLRLRELRRSLRFPVDAPLPPRTHAVLREPPRYRTTTIRPTDLGPNHGANHGLNHGVPPLPEPVRTYRGIPYVDLEVRVRFTQLAHDAYASVLPAIVAEPAEPAEHRSGPVVIPMQRTGEQVLSVAVPMHDGELVPAGGPMMESTTPGPLPRQRPGRPVVGGPTPHGSGQGGSHTPPPPRPTHRGRYRDPVEPPLDPPPPPVLDDPDDERPMTQVIRPQAIPLQSTRPPVTPIRPGPEISGPDAPGPDAWSHPSHATPSGRPGPDTADRPDASTQAPWSRPGPAPRMTPHPPAGRPTGLPPRRPTAPTSPLGHDRRAPATDRYPSTVDRRPPTTDLPRRPPQDVPRDRRSEHPSVGGTGNPFDDRAYERARAARRQAAQETQRRLDASGSGRLDPPRRSVPPIPVPERPRPRRRVRQYLPAAAMVVAAGTAVAALAVLLVDVRPIPPTNSQAAMPSVPGRVVPAGEPLMRVATSIAVPTVRTTLPVGSTPGYIETAPNGRFALIMHREAGLVSVLDTTINRISATIPIPAGPPRFVSFSPDSTRAYVSVYNEVGTVHQIAVLDTTTNQLVDTVPVGRRPFASAVTPDGARLWVPSHDDGRLDVIDTANDTVLGSIPVAPNPHWVAFSDDGDRAYVANHESNLVTVVDTRTSAILATIPVGASPHSTAVSIGHGQAAVTNFDGDSVSIIDMVTSTVVAEVPVGDNPQDLDYAPDGRYLYTTNVDDDSISVVDTATHGVTATIPACDGPTSISTHPSGRFAYVSCLNSGELMILDTTADQ